MQGLLLISSGDIARALYEKAVAYFGHVPNQFDYLTLSFQNQDEKALKEKIEELDNGDGVIIMADEIYPEEITKTCLNDNCQLITGINQPMLLNILMERMNEQPLDLGKIVGTGRQGMTVLKMETI